jgi:hypothetical protein
MHAASNKKPTISILGYTECPLLEEVHIRNVPGKLGKRPVRIRMILTEASHPHP